MSIATLLVAAVASTMSVVVVAAVAVAALTPLRTATVATTVVAVMATGSAVKILPTPMRRCAGALSERASRTKAAKEAANVQATPRTKNNERVVLA